MMKRTLSVLFFFVILFLCSTISQAATETLRPDGTDVDNHTKVGAATIHECIDEAASDDATTYIYLDGDNGNDVESLCTLSDSSGKAFSFYGITLVKCYVRGDAHSNWPSMEYDEFWLFINISDGEYETTHWTYENSWTTKSDTYSKNPITGNDWSWSEIDDLRLGVGTMDDTGTDNYYPRVTQAYVVVTYVLTNDFSNVEWTIFSDKYEFTWDNGASADYVMLRKDSGDYPTDVEDGSLVSNVTGDTELITDYSQNEESYYSMWAWNTTYSVWSTRYDFSWSDFAFENISSEEYYQKSITFNGHVSGSTAYVNYSDALGQTNDTNISVYEINGSTGNITLFYYNYTVDGQSFQRNFAINTSNNYEVILHLNHSVFGEVYDYFILMGSSRNITSPSRFDDIFDIFGNNPFGWGGFVGFFVLIVGLFSFGARNAGVALMLSGGVMVFLTAVVGITLLAGVIAILLIVMGALVQIIGGR